MNARTKIFGALGAALLALPLASCSDKSILTPTRAIPGNASRSQIPIGTLTWLAPLGTGGANPSTFDASGATRVEICAWYRERVHRSARRAVCDHAGRRRRYAHRQHDRRAVRGDVELAEHELHHAQDISNPSPTRDDGGRSDPRRRRAWPWALSRTDGTFAPLIAANELPIRFHVAMVPLAPIKINEVESSGGRPDDWVELYNPVRRRSISRASCSGTTTTRTTSPFPPARRSPQARISCSTRARNPISSTSGSVPPTRHGCSIPSAGSSIRTRGRRTPRRRMVAARTEPAGSLRRRGSTKGTANDCSNPVKINEVESNDGSNPDWIELFNPGGITVDLSGFVLKDNDDTHIFTIPAGTTIAPGGSLAFDARGFGLGSADAARLFDPAGNADRFVLVDRARGDDVRSLPEWGRATSSRPRRRRRARRTTAAARSQCA